MARDAATFVDFAPFIVAGALLLASPILSSRIEKAVEKRYEKISLPNAYSPPLPQDLHADCIAMVASFATDIFQAFAVTLLPVTGILIDLATHHRSFTLAAVLLAIAASLIGAVVFSAMLTSDRDVRDYFWFRRYGVTPVTLLGIVANGVAAAIVLCAI